MGFVWTVLNAFNFEHVQYMQTIRLFVKSSRGFSSFPAPQDLRALYRRPEESR